MSALLISLSSPSPRPAARTALCRTVPPPSTLKSKIANGSRAHNILHQTNPHAPIPPQSHNRAIGLHLIQRDFARAVTLLVTGSADGITPPPPPPEPNDSASFAPSAAAAMAWMARRNFAHDGDTKSALKALPRSMVKERAVIKGLGKAWQKRKIMMSAETAQTEEGRGGKVGGKGWAAALEDEDAASALMGLPLRDRTFCELARLLKWRGTGVELVWSSGRRKKREEREREEKWFHSHNTRSPQTRTRTNPSSSMKSPWRENG